MKQKFLAFESRLSGIIMRIACVLMAIVSVLGIAQVTSRFIINQPITWSEVLIRLMLIWMVMLGAVIAFREGAQICLDFLYRKSGRFQRKLHLLVSAVTITYLCILIWYGIDLAWRTRFQEIGSMEFLPMSVGYAALPTGAVFSIITVIANYLDPRRNDLETQQV